MDQMQTTQSISDDQELAKVLAGVSNIGDDNLGFEETPVPVTASSQVESPVVPAAAPAQSEEPIIPSFAEINDQLADATPEPVIGYNPPDSTTVSSPVNSPKEVNSYENQSVQPTPVSNDLDGIKKDALVELRPLVDKLDLGSEEKFDIYLLLLRSTDDRALIAPAHEAARNIADETKRAQALLDIIKEIDYLSNPQQS